MILHCDRRRFLFWGLGLGLSSGLAGCTAEAAPLRLAAHVWPGYELMFLARREGWLSAAQVDLVPTESATISQSLLAKGEVDAAALTLDEVLRLYDEGVALAVVLVFDESAGADVLLARPQLQTLQDLAGKRIGVETSALGAYFLHRTLEMAGLDASAVTIQPVTVDNHLMMWKSGALDALMTYEPSATQVEALGAHRLLDSRRLPGEILDVLAVRRDRLATQAVHLAALTAAHFRALRHLQKNPQDAAHRMAERLQLPADEALTAFRGLHLPAHEANRRMLSSGGAVQASASRLTQVMSGQGLLRGRIDVAGIASADYLSGSME